ncbi:MAG: hypothetical protein ACRBCI_07550 [Cellvibrionaceae bacterium]
MKTDSWILFFDSIFLVSMILMFLSLIILRLTLDPRVRKALPVDKEYNSFTDSYFGFLRVIIFSGFCVFDHMNNAPMYKNLYNDFDVRNFSNKFEKCFSYILFVSVFILVACMVFFFITKWFGIFEWPES